MRVDIFFNQTKGTSMEYGDYLLGSVVLFVGVFFYHRWKCVKQNNVALEFHPVIDSDGNRTEFVLRKRDGR